MKKQLTISLKPKKVQLKSHREKPNNQNYLASSIESTIIRNTPDPVSRPQGYSIIMHQNRQLSEKCQVRTEPNDESIFEIDEKIQKLVEQNKRLSKSLLNKQARNSSQSFTVGKSFQMTPENSLPKVTNSYQALDLTKINLRMEKLENVMENQHKDIDILRYIGQAQTDRAKTNQLDDETENLVHKNKVYSEMICEQQQQIENNKHLSQENEQLKIDNQLLQNNLFVYDQKIAQNQKTHRETKLKMIEVLNENVILNSMRNGQRADLKYDYDHVILDQEEQIQLLQKEVEQLVASLKIEKEENAYLRKMKIDEMKQLINSHNSTLEIPITSIKISEQKLLYQNRENSVASFFKQPLNQNNNDQEKKRIVLADRLNEINQIPQVISPLLMNIMKSNNESKNFIKQRS